MVQETNNASYYECQFGFYMYASSKKGPKPFSLIKQKAIMKRRE